MRAKLYPTDTSYCAEPLDIEEARALLNFCEECLHSPVLQAVLDAIKGTLDPHTQIADHPNVKFAQMQRLQWMKR